MIRKRLAYKVSETGEMHPGLICIDVSAQRPAQLSARLVDDAHCWQRMLDGVIELWRVPAVIAVSLSFDGLRGCCAIGGLYGPSFRQSASWRRLNGEPGCSSFAFNEGNLSCFTLLIRQLNSVRVALGETPLFPIVHQEAQNERHTCPKFPDDVGPGPPLGPPLLTMDYNRLCKSPIHQGREDSITYVFERHSVKPEHTLSPTDLLIHNAWHQFS